MQSGSEASEAYFQDGKIGCFAPALHDMSTLVFYCLMR